MPLDDREEQLEGNEKAVAGKVVRFLKEEGIGEYTLKSKSIKITGGRSDHGVVLESTSNAEVERS